MSYNWGIIGTGMIAHKMADALMDVKGAKLISVCSRTKKNAKKFAKEYKLKSFESDIDEFLANKKLDIVYVATPHPNHCDETIKALKAQKHVLCEKPMGMNYGEVTEMIAKAQKKKLLLMEAMWTHFFPSIIKAKELIKKGKIGEVRMIDARFSFLGSQNRLDRKLNKDLGGGALLDVGIYPIFFAQMFFDDFPVGISGQAFIGETGVDEVSAYLLKYEDGRLAKLASGVSLNTPSTAYIFGTEGFIEIPQFWQPDKIILHSNQGKKKYKFKRLGNGYTYEVQHFHKLLDDNKLESNVISYSKSSDVIQIMDEIRRQIGLKYSME